MFFNYFKELKNNNNEWIQTRLWPCFYTPTYTNIDTTFLLGNKLKNKDNYNCTTVFMYIYF